MTDQSYDSADSAAKGDVWRLSLLALVMVAAGIGLWTWSDRFDAMSANPSLILAGQTK
jgi:hypothetical protein